MPLADATFDGGAPKAGSGRAAGYDSKAIDRDGSVVRADQWVKKGGKTLMVLSPARPTQLVVLIGENNLQYLDLGQKAIGAADTYPGKPFPAVLASSTRVSM